MSRPPEPQRPEPGWERRLVTDAERAREASELYRRAGFDVRIAPALPEDFAEPCEGCWLVRSGLFRVVYTRRPRGSGA